MDYYTEDPERLEGQPKRVIADYVEQNGILVPRRFDSLEEARKSHRPVLLRSEHPQDYDGASNLMDSFQLSDTRAYMYTFKRSEDIKFSPRGMGSVEEIKEAYFRFGEEDYIGTPAYKQYFKFSGTDEEKFKQNASFSIWEAIGGINRTVVADSAIPNRFHIMSFYLEKKRLIGGDYLFNYAIVENGKLIQEFIKPLPKDLRGDLAELTGIYEEIRNMDRFDPKHCPIMEFQTFNGKNYFLQYHRARDFSPAGFTLDRSLKDGETEVLFVRGATPEEGMDCKVTVYYARAEKWDFNPEDEDGSYDFHWNQVFPELRVRHRKLQVTDGEKLEWELMKYVVKHTQTSKLFKPWVSTIFPIECVIRDNEVMYGGYDNVTFADGSKYLPREPILKEGETIFNFYEESKKGNNSYLDLHIVSDGRRAFVSRI